jgi:hypothetical protein
VRGSRPGRADGHLPLGRCDNKIGYRHFSGAPRAARLGGAGIPSTVPTSAADTFQRASSPMSVTIRLAKQVRNCPAPVGLRLRGRAAARPFCERPDTSRTLGVALQIAAVCGRDFGAVSGRFVRQWHRLRKHHSAVTWHRTGHRTRRTSLQASAIAFRRPHVRPVRPWCDHEM